MKKNILNNTFIIFTLVAFTLTSCKPIDSLIKDNKKNTSNNIQGDDSSQQASSDVNLANANLADANDAKQPENANEANKPLIDALNKKITEEQEMVKGKQESDEQHGMKTDVFKKLTNSSNQKTYDEVENKTLREQFYASLNWEKTTIEDFGKIIGQVEKDDTNKGTLPKDLIDAGHKLQDGFEKIVNQIDLKKDKLNDLPYEKMTELKAKFDGIDSLKQNWINLVKEIVKDHTDDKDSIKNDVKKLVDYIKPKYDSKIKSELDKIATTSGDIKTILDTIK
ncbi:complement regulator-acquiring protein (plasmid) [Borrelia miyamotoi]|uniref:Complement regulator-acquiring protein n=1 Tax=Borrelia miyamotoi TaxID=47466 RepID=A0AAP8YSE1_9SPIR|nr:complement regulator-acquiring protein [Borrelia miyamotoi]AHH05430.1 Antigen P35 [Borrelia miyamotoi FR64b]ATQ15227.1 complement regulator-acquiring protein [Borrelia miyamotoi]ATQ16461.1 complement regulator-acquiring protein [Borrelia miyamotoi]ATQ17556.1 complement regulator-acquiring protein [Borrelia miyamotoi]ATQ18800.1 complement regulator-acquiring protein [Borrelia miyamotoi]